MSACSRTAAGAVSSGRGTGALTGPVTCLRVEEIQKKPTRITSDAMLVDMPWYASPRIREKRYGVTTTAMAAPRSPRRRMRARMKRPATRPRSAPTATTPGIPKFANASPMADRLVSTRLTP